MPLYKLRLRTNQLANCLVAPAFLAVSFLIFFSACHNSSNDGEAPNTDASVEEDSVPPPAILSDPQDCMVTVPDTATFLVTATDTLPLTFQWYRNGTLIPDATKDTYTTQATSASDDGAIFTVDVSNGKSSVTSKVAKLRVKVITRAISGTIFGSTLNGVSVSLNGATVATTESDAKGNFIFEDLVPGNYRLTPSLNGLHFQPPWIDVTVGSSDVAGLTFVDLDNNSAITADVYNMQLASTQIPLGGLTWFTATFINWTNSDLKDVMEQGYVVQGSVRKGADAMSLDCSQDIGVVPPGLCVVNNYSFSVTNSNGGSGKLVPGPAIAEIIFYVGNDVIRQIDIPINITAQ